MRPKYFVYVIGFFTLIFLGIYLLVSQSSIFDLWMFNKIQPRLCLQEEADGQKVFGFCDTLSGENSK